MSLLLFWLLWMILLTLLPRLANMVPGHVGQQGKPIGFRDLLAELEEDTTRAAIDEDGLIDESERLAAQIFRKTGIPIHYMRIVESGTYAVQERIELPGGVALEFCNENLIALDARTGSQRYTSRAQVIAKHILGITQRLVEKSKTSKAIPIPVTVRKT